MIRKGLTGSKANAVLRINYERCMVDLRNQHLAHIVSETIGETTGRVYAVLLRMITESTPRCRLEPDKDDVLASPRYASTDDIFSQLDSAVDVFVGIGKTARDKIDTRFAEKLQRQPQSIKAPYDEADDDGDGSGDEDEDMNDEDEYDSEADDIEVPTKAASAVNGSKESKVTFEDSTQNPQSRLGQTRQHLLLLCNNKLGFARHSGRGIWTVDFEPLLRKLQEMQLDQVMEQKVGRQGLRLARILRRNGKLDEKTLPALAMMKKGDVHHKMLQLQMHGYAEIQEVPRDNSRQANRTMFFWYCSVERAFAQQLDNAYKAMLRCLQVCEVQRQAHRDVLASAERPDVKGREKEALEKKYYDKYQKYRDMEKMLLGEALRLDDMVSVLSYY